MTLLANHVDAASGPSEEVTLDAVDRRLVQQLKEDLRRAQRPSLATRLFHLHPGFRSKKMAIIAPQCPFTKLLTGSSHLISEVELDSYVDEARINRLLQHVCSELNGEDVNRPRIRTTTAVLMFIDVQGAAVDEVHAVSKYLCFEVAIDAR